MGPDCVVGDFDPRSQTFSSKSHALDSSISGPMPPQLHSIVNEKATVCNPVRLEKPAPVVSTIVVTTRNTLAVFLGRPRSTCHYWSSTLKRKSQTVSFGPSKYLRFSRVRKKGHVQPLLSQCLFLVCLAIALHGILAKAPKVSIEVQRFTTNFASIGQRSITADHLGG